MNGVHYTDAMAVQLTEEQVRHARERVREVAERHIALYGPDVLSMRSVAAELGWPVASLYRYFTNKSEMLEAVRISALDRFTENMRAAYESTTDPWDRSRAIGDAYVDFAEREPACYQLMFSWRLNEESENSQALKDAEARSRQTLTAYIQDMIDAGMMSGDAKLIGHAYWSAIHGLIALRMAGKLDGTLSFDTLRHAIVRLITLGARYSPQT